MYISKALQNIRQRPSGQYGSLAYDTMWGSPLLADFTQPGVCSAGLDRSCGIFFTSGGIITDDNWMAIQAIPNSLTAVRTWLANNGRSDVVVPTSFTSTGVARILYQEGQRVFDLSDNNLGYFTYGTAFNRMYIALTNTTSISASTALTSYIELTPADLQAMGASITIDSSGNGTLTAPLCLNNLILK